MAVKKFYAVTRGKVPGIYDTWAACEKQVIGFPHQCFQGFRTLEEAEAFFKAGSDSCGDRDDQDSILNDNNDDNDESDSRQGAAPAPNKSAQPKGHIRGSSGPQSKQKGAGAEGSADNGGPVSAQGSKGKTSEGNGRQRQRQSQNKRGSWGRGRAGSQINFIYAP
ncbi:Caulimovirus viroplasmin-domain-containing protein [Cercophora newfieldiana]|uniref:ribonuclease H n=1 Tax=Cercophora newfieldiana TaxID=92897 RepID=A0AA40CIH4_9PEZI|nr:Caulimovirus viroplasmin-domain-containing protein [Cercophora newfieldiana]